MPPSSRPPETPGILARLVWSSAGFVLAVAFAVAAARYYETPRFTGKPSGSLWLEPDFVCTALSSVLAVALGAWSNRAATRAGAALAGSLVLRMLIWSGLTLLFLGIWVEYVYLFALLIAPAHAFAALRLIGLWSRWRADRAWRRS